MSEATTILNVTVTKVIPGMYPAIVVEWDTPVEIKRHFSSSMTLYSLVSKSTKVGDVGRLEIQDSPICVVWKFIEENQYYKKELNKTLPPVLVQGEVPTMVVRSSAGGTKTLSINLESIPAIRHYLNCVERRLQRVR